MVANNNNNGNGNGNGKRIIINPEQVALRLYDMISSEVGRDSIHTVFSGFNETLRRLGINPIEVVEKLVKQGKLFSRPAKGGAIISRRAFTSSKVIKYEEKLREIFNLKD
mgnify:CR=1 FL=1